MSHQEKRTVRDPLRVLHDEIEAHEGFKSAAKRTGRSAQVLYNQFSEEMPHYKVGVLEALALALPLPTTGFVDAMCEQFGGVFMAVPESTAGADDVLQAYLDIIHQMGDLSREFTEARADGVIEPREFSALQLRGRRTMAAIGYLLAELETQVHEAPALPLRRVGS